MEKMVESVAQNVGVDISKHALDVYLHPAGTARSVANDAAGIAALIAWLRGFPISRIVFEPTGCYHQVFERRLGEAGLPLVKINPRQARRFAEAIGRHAKTDAVDASMLARLGAMLQPPARPIPSQALHEMKELHVARCALLKDRVAATNRHHIRCLSLLRDQAQQRLRQIDRQIIAIDTALQAILNSNVALKARFDILTSIPGIGKVTAFAILIEMPELGTIENKAAASLAGLAPVARDSGRWHGRRFIRGGRANLRQALYMPALVAIRFNPSLSAKYRALIQAGKAPKLAITAIMRKLLILANALLRDGRCWSEIAAAPS
jgi:transposase